MSINLGNLPILATVKTSFAAPNEGVKAIVIGNESALTVTITMESGGVQKTLYPATVDWFAVGNGFSGNILISPVAILNNAAQWPSSSLVFDAIGINDPETAAQYPLSLNRGVNVGNSISVPSSATSIANDGSVVSTSILESTVLGDIASAVSLTNDAQLVLGTAANKASATMNGNKVVAASRFAGSADANGLTIAHNYAGGTPNYIGISVHTLSSTPHAWSVKNITATQVTVYTDAPAGSPIGFDGIAMKL